MFIFHSVFTEVFYFKLTFLSGSLSWIFCEISDPGFNPES